MKEALRKLQWCPHRRTPITIDQNAGPPIDHVTVAGNSAPASAPPPPFLLEVGTCIGSACSQWRWDTALVLDVVLPLPGAAVSWFRGSDGQLWRNEPLPRPPGVDASFVWRPVLGRWDKLIAPPPGDRDGHCGLSGAAAYD